METRQSLVSRRRSEKSLPSEVIFDLLRKQMVDIIMMISLLLSTGGRTLDSAACDIDLEYN